MLSFSPRRFVPVIGILFAFSILWPINPAHAGFERLLRLMGTPLASRVLARSEARQVLESAMEQLGASASDDLEQVLRSLSHDQLARAESVYELREIESNLAAIQSELRGRGLMANEGAVLEAGADSAVDSAVRRLFQVTPHQVEFFGRSSPARLRTSGHGTFAQSRATFLRVNDPARVTAIHDSITTDLFNGRVVHAERFSANDNRNPIFLVELFNPATGRTRQALFKPRPPGDGDGWNRTPMEYVSYEFQRMLGMDYIPPAAYRHGVRLGGSLPPVEGAMLYLVPDAQALHPVARSEWGTDVRLMLSDTRIVDTLLMNPDRHINNFLRGRHWVDGELRPMLIDHAASLRPSTQTHLEQNDAFKMGATRVIRRSTWEALNALGRGDLNSLSPFVSRSELDGIMRRRHQIIDYFNAQIGERGYVNVVIEAR